MNPTPITSAPSVQHMDYNGSAGPAQVEQRSGLIAAARQQASTICELEGVHVFHEIVSRCNTIDRQMYLGVPLKSRMALAELLIDQGIKNPGGLTTRQENVCAWVMLEHTALNANEQLSFNQLQSFTKRPGQLDIATKIASQLSLTQERFTR